MDQPGWIFRGKLDWESGILDASITNINRFSSKSARRLMGEAFLFLEVLACTIHTRHYLTTYVGRPLAGEVPLRT